jgi:deoxycytidine triphosphate deaminase
MTVLSDSRIKYYCRHGLVSPYDERLVGPASLDVRLGDNLKIEDPSGNGLTTLSISDKNKENPYHLSGFTLGHTLETFRIPDNLCAFFILKSARGREGISHALSGFADPGWENSRLTLELHRLLRFSCPHIWPGMRIGQFVFMEMSDIPEKSYREVGHYNNDLTVMESKGYFD